MGVTCDSGRNETLNPFCQNIVECRDAHVGQKFTSSQIMVPLRTNLILDEVMR